MFTKVFIKTLKSTATDMYLQNMLAAVLGELSGAQVYLTQCKLRYKAPIVGRGKVHEEILEIGVGRPYADRLCRVNFETNYASLESPRRYGRENQYPSLPRALGYMIVTSETADFIDWDLCKIRVEVSGGVGDFTSGGCTRIFDKLQEGAEWIASTRLQEFSTSLRHWSPKRAGYTTE